MTSRIHAFDALDNFRDYGGYDTAAGRALRSGRLFRSAHQASVSAADLERLAALDLGVVVDLRRPVERRRQPSKRAAYRYFRSSSITLPGSELLRPALNLWLNMLGAALKCR